MAASGGVNLGDCGRSQEARKGITNSGVRNTSGDQKLDFAAMSVDTSDGLLSQSVERESKLSRGRSGAVTSNETSWLTTLEGSVPKIESDGVEESVVRIVVGDVVIILTLDGYNKRVRSSSEGSTRFNTTFEFKNLARVQVVQEGLLATEQCALSTSVPQSRNVLYTEQRDTRTSSSDTPLYD